MISKFKEFSQVVAKQFDEMAKGDLFTVGVTGDVLWETYLNSFPDGSNPLFKTNTEHDCSCCRGFIKNMGNVVTIKDGQLISLWDVVVPFPYQHVTDAMNELVKSNYIEQVFASKENSCGKAVTYQQLEDGTVIDWNHFHCDIPQKHITSSVADYKQRHRSKAWVFKRGLEEITLEALESTLDLIQENNLYRGLEFKSAISDFGKLHKAYSRLEGRKAQNAFIWDHHNTHCATIKNTAIGTILKDLSEGVDLEIALRKWESVMAPSNYRRPKAVITKRMIENAVTKIRELGYESALQRRYARVEDISVNDILFVNRETSALMKDGLTDMLMAQAKPNLREPKGKLDIGIEAFINDVLPHAQEVEVYLDRKHGGNLVSLIAPEDQSAKNILAWDNNFSWSYNGNLTDSIKERVKKAGGNVEAPVRVSLSWFNKDDLDIHVFEPDQTHIHYGNRVSRSGGELDVDMNVETHNAVSDAVENITWKNIDKMPDGFYKVVVNNYFKREQHDIGFEIEFCLNGESYFYTYNKPVPNKGDIFVFDIIKTGKNFALKTNPDMAQGESQSEMWGLKTGEYQKVNCINLSPNYWNGQANGNKHYMFMLDSCKRNEDAIGLYNEFLSNEVREHRKVFEVLASQMKCKDSEQQLNGLGFSSTIKNTLVCRVKTADSKKLYNIQFGG